MQADQLFGEFVCILAISGFAETDGDDDHFHPLILDLIDDAVSLSPGTQAPKAE